MAGRQTRKNKKQPATQSADIKKSLTQAKAKNQMQPPPPVEPERKKMTGGFLSYLASAMNSKSEETSEQAKVCAPAVLHSHK